MFSIAALLKAILLCLNAMAILSERRFLAPLGLATASVTAEHQQHAANPNKTTSNFYNEDPFGGGGGVGGGGINPHHYNNSNVVVQSAVKAQIAQLLGSIRMLLRWPLMIANIVMIVFSLVFG